ncbi:MAG: serine/threonine-protein kinase [Vicinamibacterales bacterium]
MLLAFDNAAGDFLSEPVLQRHQDLLADDERFASGEMVGPYRIERELGRGGMGVVYLASDTTLGRAVALKVLAPGMVSDPGQRQRLVREARAAAQISHPGICTVYALEERGDEFVIASEYIDGRSLRADIEAGSRPSAAELDAAIRALVSALAAAHASGVVHRDLKPENVMRTSGGIVKVLDFGLALVDDRERGPMPRTTTPGTVIGTPAYMAPEQIRHETVDARTDIFALGVLLFEFATGVHPFHASTALGLWARMLEGEPTPLRDLRPDLSIQVQHVIMRCLQRRASDRFQSASDIVAVLDGPAAAETAAPDGFWWRVHMSVILTMYVVAALAAWSIHELVGSVGRSGFAAVAMLGTVGGIFRGHLLFSERQLEKRPFLSELRRSALPLHVVDLLLAVVLVVAGFWISATVPVRGALVSALGLGFALARLVLERSTTRAVFSDERER